MSMLVGYARVSTAEQSLALQRDALQAAGCGKVFEDVLSGAKADRPGLRAALDYVRGGDTLVVWKLDRLGRSLPHLIETVETWRKGRRLQEPPGEPRHHHRRRPPHLPPVRRAGRVRARPRPRAHRRGAGRRAGAGAQGGPAARPWTSARRGWRRRCGRTPPSPWPRSAGSWASPRPPSTGTRGRPPGEGPGGLTRRRGGRGRSGCQGELYGPGGDAPWRGKRLVPDAQRTSSLTLILGTPESVLCSLCGLGVFRLYSQSQALPKWHYRRRLGVCCPLPDPDG